MKEVGNHYLFIPPQFILHNVVILHTNYWLILVCLLDFKLYRIFSNSTISIRLGNIELKETKVNKL